MSLTIHHKHTCEVCGETYRIAMVERAVMVECPACGLPVYAQQTYHHLRYKTYVLSLYTRRNQKWALEWTQLYNGGVGEENPQMTNKGVSG